jgi:NAD(P)-dependent dehydrogenase (short-subunit alcohol dehydrogenase family)
VKLDGKVALVTGAARGIGRALADGLAAEGAIVHTNDLHESPQIGDGLALEYDVSQRAHVAQMFAQLDELDVLVNCAGITGWLNVDDPREETWDAVVDTNLKGTFFCSLEAAPFMRRRGGGSIVNVSSVVGARGMKNLSVYGASKGGVNALTVQLAVELAPHNIRVNAFAPGATNVERNLADDPRYVEIWEPLIPLGRVGEPEDMVGPCVFFASDDSRFVTGQLLYVDGGWTATSPYPESYVEAAERKQGGTP